MSNYKLWELANQEGVKGLLPFVEEAVLAFSEVPRRSLGPSVDEGIGEPIARYLHSKLMTNARPIRTGDPRPPHSEYTHVAYPQQGGLRDAYGELSFTRILTTVSGGVLDKEELRQLAGSVQVHFRYYRLASSMQGSGRAGYWLRPWPADLRWEHHSKELIYDRLTEKRIVEEADKPVSIAWSSKAVIGDIPEKVTPEWAVETIKRMAKAFDKLANRYDALAQDYEKVNTRLEELEKDPWAEAGDELRTTFGTENGQSHSEINALPDAVKDTVQESS